MIHIKNLEAGYPGNKIYNKLNLSFDRGEFISILGPNGCGKSTLLKLVIGFLDRLSGDILIDKQDINKINSKDLAKKVTLIPQESHIQYNFTVEEIITMGRFPFISFWNSYSQEDKQVVEEIITKLQLGHLRNKYINQLSGGEKQRTYIGRAIAQNTDYILLDETFSHLDINHQIEILNIMKKLHQEEKKTIIMISHNINLASNYSERMIILKEGQVIADGAPSSVLNEANLEQAFNIKLGIVTNPITNKPNVIYP